MRGCGLQKGAGRLVGGEGERVVGVGVEVGVGVGVGVFVGVGDEKRRPWWL